LISLYFYQKTSIKFGFSFLLKFLEKQKNSIK